MKLERYFPAKNLVLLEPVVTKTSKSGSIILATEQSAGYYRVVKVGPLCEKTKVGNYIISTLQMGVELEFEEGTFMQLPEQGIDGYYQPSEDEIKAPTPIVKYLEKSDEESLNIIDSEGGNNELGSELGLRED